MEIKHEDYLLLAIKPKWANAILEGRKTWEFRKKQPVKTNKLLIYSTVPVGALIGVATIERTLTVFLDDLWKLSNHGELGCVTQEEFDKYFQGKDRGTAIILSNPTPIKPIPMNRLKEAWHPWHPPQGFQYISNWEFEQAIRQVAA